MNMSRIKTHIHDHLMYDMYDEVEMNQQQYDEYIAECESIRQAEINRREAALWLSQADDNELPF